jgi:hypothetical protein
MNGWSILQARLLGLSNSSTAVTFETEPVLPGEVWEIISLSAANSSGESVTASFAVVTGAEVIQLAATATVADGDATTTTAAPLLIEGQRIRATFKGSAKVGPVAALVTGRRLPFPPSATPLLPLAAQEALEE